MNHAENLCIETLPNTSSVRHGFPVCSGQDELLPLVRDAADRFRTVPMPLETCLLLRKYLAERSGQDDPLSHAVLSWRTPASGFHDPVLESLLSGHEIGGWALGAETIEFLVEILRARRPSSVLEFGSGTSTVVLAWLMRQLHGDSNQPRVFSIDQSDDYVERTRSWLARHNLRDRVKFLRRPVVRQTIAQFPTACYDLPPVMLAEFFGPVRPDCVLIDGPAGDNGVRFGTLPLVQNHLTPGAAIFMDDGLRDSELDSAERWNRLGYVRWDGLYWLGKGLLSGTVIQSQPATATWLERAYLLTASSDPSFVVAPRTVPSMASLNSKVRSYAAIPEAPVDAKDITHREARSCLFLNTYYPGFLTHHYGRHPELDAASYDIQHRSLQSSCFGDSDFYSTGLKQAGWQASELILNCEPLQRQWAKEQGIGAAGGLLAIGLEQIARMQPDVLYLQDFALATKPFLEAVRPHVRLIVGQIASKMPPQAYLDGFDILVSSFPHFVDRFRQQGRIAYYQPLAFDPRVLERIGAPGREFPLSFVGGLSPVHKERRALLVALGASLPIHCWGYGTESLRQQGIDPSRLHGEAWGLDMFSVLARSRITVNHHSEDAETNANNMRLFEATGCGSLLVTDYKDNLGDLFEIGTEILAYRSDDECRELIAYYLAHPEEAAAIAKRGQARTLRDHTYGIRMAHTAEFLGRHLAKRQGRQRLPEPELNRVSYGKTAIEPDAITAELEESWRSELIPERQRALVERELDDLYRGQPPLVFRVLADAVQPYVRPGIGFLEVGCASGYYSEVLEYLLQTRLSYVGVDFSDAMIRMARRYYPGVPFEIGDGGALRFADRSIPIVVSSGVLLHVQNYATHIQEAARVASEIVVLHRTPISRTRPTSHYKKFAYGVETYELRFHEEELIRLCAEAGLELLTATTYDNQPERDEFEATYVFRVAGC